MHEQPTAYVHITGCYTYVRTRVNNRGECLTVLYRLVNMSLQSIYAYSNIFTLANQVLITLNHRFEIRSHMISICSTKSIEVFDYAEQN